MATETFQPGDLLVNDYPVAVVPVTIVSGENLARGAVLGLITASGKYKLSASAASDGSEDSTLVLAVDTDASAADVDAVAYASGAFDGAKLVLGTGTTTTAVEAAWRAAMAPMFVKTPV